jgi:hypothetical protein
MPCTVGCRALALNPAWCRAVHQEEVHGGEDSYLNKEARFHQGRKTANAKNRTTTPRKRVKVGST